MLLSVISTFTSRHGNKRYRKMKFIEVIITGNGKKTLIEKRCRKCNQLGFVCLGIIKENNCMNNYFSLNELNIIKGPE